MNVPRRYVTSRDLDVLRLGLSERDVAILLTLREYRLATGAQLRRWHFAGHASPTAAARAARSGLKRLAELGLLDHLQRRIGGVRSGSTGYIWHLSRAGHRLLAHIEGTALPARLNVAEPSLRKVDHTLAVTEVGLRLYEETRAGRLEVIECSPEPSCWRSYLSTGGVRATLKPDLFAVTAKPGDDSEALHFIEVDRATESPTTIQRKAAQYTVYQRIGLEQKVQGVFPYVVWLVPDEQQADRLRAALAADRRIETGIHQVMRLDAFVQNLTKKGGST